MVTRALDGGVVAEVVELPDTDDTVVLLDPERRPDGVLRYHPFPNILRVGPNDEVRWRAELVPSETAWKCWLGVAFDGSLRAWTASCNCVLDGETGQMVETTFVK